MHERLRANQPPLEIYPLPEVAWRILRLTSDLEIESRTLEEVIQREPALVARILRRANSAQFAVSGQVSTIHRAAVILGNRRLRSIAVLLSLEGVFGRTALGRRVWEHSLAVAFACRELAPYCSVRNDEEAFVAGLLHDVGKTILDRCFPSEYAELVESAESSREPLLQAEREAFGTDHTELGAQAALSWGLPLQLEEVIRLHHAPSEAAVDPTFCALVQVADVACQSLGIGEGDEPGPTVLDYEPDSLFLLDPDLVAHICEPIRSMLEMEACYFGFNSPSTRPC